MNVWDKSSIRGLRLRLGLSQCDMARHLGVEWLAITLWESGEVELQGEVIHQLEFLDRQAEQYTNDIIMSPFADTLFLDGDLDQVYGIEILEMDGKEKAVPR